ncbi:MAG: CidA/LrgA family protein [Marivita sp.]|uniref:CidA/LrgA family protein n=1 Tax=Marivita sp. TaxID=2003365 RepID=UPI001B281340|nr:CidA/LrgA family protein [Marivita sp.]MBO6883137.1 CidA/LrgA family protein [Marivita sp.]
MVEAIAILLGCQLVGEVVARALTLPVPGPVIGLGLLAVLLLACPDLTKSTGPAARVILANLSLLFVPAGVGVVGNLGVLSENWVAFAVVLLASTIAAMLASVGAFLFVQRFLGRSDE